MPPVVSVFDGLLKPVYSFLPRKRARLQNINKSALKPAGVAVRGPLFSRTVSILTYITQYITGSAISVLRTLSHYVDVSKGSGKRNDVYRRRPFKLNSFSRLPS